MKASAWRRWMMYAAGCVATALTAYTTGSISPGPPDARIARIEAFFESYGCPSPHYAAEYVRAADLYRVDYRILPSISLLESTCGSYQQFNNHWGWNAAQTRFRSVPEGIDYVTRQLAQERPYIGRDLDAKLFYYNHRKSYVRAAKRLMNEIEE